MFGCQAGHHGHTVVVGLPYDRGTAPGHSGCWEAPDKLRTLSDVLQIDNNSLYDLKSCDFFSGGNISDIGNIRFKVEDGDSAYFSLASLTARTLAEHNKKLLFLGGDHLVTLPILRGLKAAGRTVQLIQLDAHHDYAPIKRNEHPTHATFVSFIMREQLATQILQIGIRGLAWGEPKAPNNVHTLPLMDLASAIQPNVDVYLTVDTDAFDPTIAPGVGFPEPTGLSLQDLEEVLAIIHQQNLSLIAADWTEYNPRYDTKNLLTGRFVLRGLGLITKSLTQNSLQII